MVEVNSTNASYAEGSSFDEDPTRYYFTITFDDVTREETQDILGAVYKVMQGSLRGMSVHYSESLYAEVEEVT